MWAANSTLGFLATKAKKEIGTVTTNASLRGAQFFFPLSLERNPLKGRGWDRQKVVTTSCILKSSFLLKLQGPSEDLRPKTSLWKKVHQEVVVFKPSALPGEPDLELRACWEQGFWRVLPRARSGSRLRPWGADRGGGRCSWPHRGSGLSSASPRALPLLCFLS